MSSGFSRRGFLAAAAALAGELAALREAAAEDRAASDLDRTAFGTPQLREVYSLHPEITYLNHASIGTIPRPVQSARQRYLELCEDNPWLYMWGGAWEESREDVRRAAARLLGCDAGEVALLHNTTEAFNLLAHGLPLQAGDEVLFSTLNHSGASVAWELAASRGIRARRFEIDLATLGSMDAAEVVALHAEAIGPRTRVLVLPHIDNTLGLRHPVAAITNAARRRGVRWVAIDGAQSIGMLPVDVTTLGVDLYATSPHKWPQSPKGLGLAYIRRELQEELRPMWATWGQKRWGDSVRRFEDYGTRNLPEVLALGDAIAFHEDLGGAHAMQDHHHRLWNAARAAVDANPRLTWRSPASWELGAALYSIEVRNASCLDLAAELFQEHGIVVRPFAVQGLEMLRLSPNVMNTTDEVERTLELVTA